MTIRSMLCAPALALLPLCAFATPPNWQELAPLNFRHDNGISMTVASNGDVLTGDATGYVHRWTAGKRWKHKKHPYLDTPVYCLAESKGLIFAAGYGQFAVKQGARMTRSTLPLGPVYGCAFQLAKPNIVALSDHSGQLIIWDVRERIAIVQHQFESAGTSLAWAGDHLYVGHMDGTVTVWNTLGMKASLKSHNNRITSMIYRAPHWIITGDDQGVMNVWDSKKHSFASRLNAGVGAITNLDIERDILLSSGLYGAQQFKLQHLEKTGKAPRLVITKAGEISSRAYLSQLRFRTRNHVVGIDRLSSLRHWKTKASAKPLTRSLSITKTVKPAATVKANPPPTKSPTVKPHVEKPLAEKPIAKKPPVLPPSERPSRVTKRPRQSLRR